MGSLFDEPTMDNALPLEDIIKNMKGEYEKPAEETTPVVTPTPTEEAPKPERKLTPLEQMKLDLEKNSRGVVFDDEELEKGMMAPVTDSVHTEDRMSQFQKAIDSYDDTLQKRNALVIVQKPVTQIEYVQMMDEVEAVAFDENGKPYLTIENPKFVRLRKEDEEMFDYSVLDEREKRKLQINKEMTEKESETTKDSKDSSESGQSAEEAKPEDHADAEKKQLVKVLIDKTGLGKVIDFTEEERKKLVEADLIKVTEVKTVDIEAVRAKKSNKSFHEALGEFDYHGPKTNICFPLSGFTAQMKGLTFGQYQDIIRSMDANVDRQYKIMTIIYHNMVNISSGPFKDFDDFLHHFAFQDTNLALYGMLIASEKGNQSMTVTCHNCETDFELTYDVRSLLRLDKCSKGFLDQMDIIMDARPTEYKKIQENAPVNTVRVIRLPDTQAVAEIGQASVYEFIYNFLPAGQDKNFKELFGEDAEMDDDSLAILMLLMGIRTLYIPDPESDEFFECKTYEEIIRGVMSLSPSDMAILSRYIEEILGQYQIVFGIPAKCPNCGTITELVEIDISDMFFRLNQRLTNLEVDLSQLQLS